MLNTNTAYPITKTNVDILYNITGIDKKTIVANIGWCATFSETRYPRWMIVPKSVAVHDMQFTVDEQSYP